jgi:hypothetical protein
MMSEQKRLIEPPALQSGRSERHGDHHVNSRGVMKKHKLGKRLRKPFDAEELEMVYRGCQCFVIVSEGNSPGI